MVSPLRAAPAVVMAATRSLCRRQRAAKRAPRRRENRWPRSVAGARESELEPPEARGTPATAGQERRPHLAAVCVGRWSYRPCASPLKQLRTMVVAWPAGPAHLLLSIPLAVQSSRAVSRSRPLRDLLIRIACTGVAPTPTASRRGAPRPSPAQSAQL